MTPHQRRESGRTRATSPLTALGAVLGVAALVISTSLPAAALYRTDSAFALSARGSTPQNEASTQSFTADLGTAPAVAASVGRDGYAVTPPPPPPPPPPRVIRAVPLGTFAPVGSLLYTPNPGGAIQWPFARYVPIASGFGPRSSPCGGCSSFHEGLDMLAGAGAAVGAIAPGVVSAAGPDPVGSYGTRVVIEHVVNGQVVRSLYAHMIAGSTTVTVGQTVSVGQTVGLVGNTGASSGAHLHLGISVDGALIDPYAWLIANAK